MTTDLEVVESVSSRLHISESQALRLSLIGSQLASSKAWWAQSQPSENRTVIDVRPAFDGSYNVTFREVVGVVQFGSLRIKVSPKIRWEHFVYIAARSEFSPRISTDVALIAPGFEFLGMLCHWFVDAVERLLRLGLRQDYCEKVEELGDVRGRLVPYETALAVLQGRPVATCAFDELSYDTPLNRILRAACERVSCLTQVAADTRRRARRLVYRMDGVGPMRHGDRRIKPDRLSKSYRNPISLAALILDSGGLSISQGGFQGTSFLLRTPDIIESGMRSIIAEGLEGISVSKRRHLLGNSGISMNPDIVFGQNLAVADVKYKYFQRDWNRSDFNQIVAFATAFASMRCVLVGFVSGSDFKEGMQVQVGQVGATRIAWRVGHDTLPEVSANVLIGALRQWLAS